MAENVFHDKALQKYLNDISSIPTLSREEEQELAHRCKLGDKKAQDRLIQANLKFVVKIASHYQNRGLSLSELISEGNMGLIAAIDKFEPDKNIKLISYAVWWIRQRILFALAEKTSIIRTPLGKSNLANKIRKAKEKIFSGTGRQATMADVSAATKLNSKVIHKIEEQITDAVSLDEISYTADNDEVRLQNFLFDVAAEDPKQLYYHDKIQNRIQKSISSLPARDAYIVRQYFGLDGEEGKNFAQIAEELGISRERVRQIQKAAIKKITDDSMDTYNTNIDYLLY